MLHYHLFEFDPAFDLLNDKLPDALHGYFGDQLNRARALLVGRTPTQVDYLLDSLDWMLRESGPKEFDTAMTITERDGECFVSRVKALKLRYREFDISNQSWVLDASWVDYFAVLTLAYIDEMLYEYKQANETRESQFKIDPASLMIDWALEAMDAVCYAELLKAVADQLAEHDMRTKMDIDTAVREELQERGRKGGLKRAEPFAHLRQKVLQRYEMNYMGKSAHKAATLIYEDLKMEVDKILSKYEPEKRLEKWIGQHRRRLRQQDQSLPERSD